MNKKELINQLIKLGWVPAPYAPIYDSGFYLWKEFEISQSRELEYYTDYTPKEDELIFIMYEIYPNLEYARYCMWSSDDLPGEYLIYEDDYQIIVDLALEDRLFTYHR